MSAPRKFVAFLTAVLIGCILAAAALSSPSYSSLMAANTSYSHDEATRLGNLACNGLTMVGGDQGAVASWLTSQYQVPAATAVYVVTIAAERLC